MTPDQLRDIMGYLRDRVQLGSPEPGIPVVITFQAPGEDEMTSAGLDPDGVKRLLGVEWWEEMAEDVIGTPDFCDPDDAPEQVLAYARDVVSEYIRKRFPLDPG